MNDSITLMALGNKNLEIIKLPQKILQKINKRETLSFLHWPYEK